MRKLVAALLMTLVVSYGSAARADEDLSVSAKGIVVMDADTGKIIISKNKDLKLQPASTTKVMTALLAMEKTKPTDVVKVSKNATTMSPSKVYLRQGDEVTVEALLYSLLLKSANDSACALAEGVAGSEPAFAKMMTDEAHRLGALNTNFSNASGLPAENHYTTAADLALILRAAMQNERFMAISSTKFATLNMGEKERMLLKNHNKLLWFYDGAGAGKTGYTVAARHCYVGEANCRNTRLIVAVLHSGDLWGDVKKCLDKGFELAITGQTLAMGDTEEGDTYIKRASYKVSKKAHHVRRHHKKRRRRTT